MVLVINNIPLFDTFQAFLGTLKILCLIIGISCFFNLWSVKISIFYASDVENS